MQFPTVEQAVAYFSSAKNSRRNIDDSFWICDLGDAKKKLDMWNDLMPRVIPYFAMKSAPHVPLIKLLTDCGAGVDCASQEEMDIVLGMGLSPDRIVYSNTSKQISHLLHARELGVKLATFDSREELEKIKDFFPESELLLRIKTDSKESYYDLSERFGATTEDSFALLDLARDLAMNVTGVSFHVGSGCENPAAFTTALSDAKRLFDYAATIGLRFGMLDIGGGFHGTPNKSPSVEKFASVINEGLKGLFPTADYPDLRVISEPGRYFATGTFSLVSTIIAKRSVSRNEDYSLIYTTNEGICSCFMPVVGCPIPDMEDISILGGDSGRKYVKSRMYGPICSNVDVLMTRLLPEMEVGDRLIWKNTGAYTFSCGGRFNGFGATVFYDIATSDITPARSDTPTSL